MNYYGQIYKIIDYSSPTIIVVTLPKKYCIDCSKSDITFHYSKSRALGDTFITLFLWSNLRDSFDHLLWSIFFIVRNKHNNTAHA